MKKNPFKKATLALASACILLVMLTSAAFAADHSDIKDHWAEESIERWSEYGVLNGYSDGTFRPDNTMSRAELAAILNRLLKYPAIDGPVAGINSGEWFHDDVAALLSQRYIHAPDGDFNAAITREEAIYMIGKAFGLNENIILFNHVKFTDHSDILPCLLPRVVDMKSEKYIGGYPDGSFRPQNTISRAEVVTILDKMITAIITEPGEYSFSKSEKILVLSPNVKINIAREPDLGAIRDARIFITPCVTGKEAVSVSGDYQELRIYTVGYNRDVISYEKNQGCYDLFDNLSINKSSVVLANRPDAERMMIAMGSMLTYINARENIFVGAVYQGTLYTNIDDVTSGANNLRNSWGISSREELISSIQYYTLYGNHNSLFLAEAADILALSDEEIEVYASTYSNGFMFRQLRDFNDKWGDIGIPAWDLFRIANLALWGYDAEYITYNEALELIAPAAQQLSTYFDTWEDAYDNYLDGYAWWSRSDISETRPREDYWKLMNAFYPDVFDDSLLS